MALTRISAYQVSDEQWKTPVRAATTVDVGDLQVGNAQPSTVDGVTLSTGDRILVKNQGNTKQNGLWYVRSPGTGSNGYWSRAFDANDPGEVASGLTVAVSEGSINGSQEYRLTTPNPITLDATGLTFINPFQASVPGGANTYVQFNDNNTLSGSSAFVFNKYANFVTITGNLSVSGNILVANLLYPNGAPYSTGGGSGSSYYIYSGGSNVTVTASNVNVSINGSNVASFGSSGLQVLTTATSTSTTTGALTVAGGVGVSGNLFVGQGIHLANAAVGTGASAAYMQFNSTANSIDFIFG